MCICVCVCARAQAWVPIGQKRASDFPEPELLAVVSCSMRVLGTQAGSSAKAADVPNCLAISPAPERISKTHLMLFGFLIRWLIDKMGVLLSTLVSQKDWSVVVYRVINF